MTRTAMRRILVLAALALGPAPAALGEEIPFGDRFLVLDPAEWEISTLMPGQVTRLVCLAPDCRNMGGLFPDLYAVSFSTRSGALRTCSAAQGSIPITETEDGPFMQHSATYAGIEFNVLGLISECVRQRPVLLQACGLHEETLYWLTTSFSGCSPEPDLPQARFDEILRSLNMQSSAVQ
ncbi:MAG: hypothetical protein IT535_10955 [Bauldia sp.]|nr:hypothetical protein [Bauldia sp.]